MKELLEAIEKMTSEQLVKVVISNKVNKENKYNKIIFVLKEKNNQKYYQIEKYTDKQVFHQNIEINMLNEKLIEYLSFDYKQASAWSKDSTYDLKISKKGKIFLGKKSNNNTKLINLKHNKQKNYILKEGMIIEPLIDLGIFTKDGKVINSMYDKYKQINRFIEIIDDEIKKRDYKELTVIDFGCGKSYLTFVLYYYFTKIKNINVKMVGLDLKDDVINKCNKIAERYGYDGLIFERGDINGYKYSDNVDMVITLHACDTATDYALYNAIKWNAQMIFSVPCCQHELNKQIHSENLSIINRYGIIQERMSALMTDAIRGNLLEYMGYKTQIMEFIDMVHSPKNILIRATKANISNDTKKKSIKEAEELIKEFNLSPTLYNLLK
ncbi:MAG: SAM-dependent methyltransferase [Clostridium sp.]|nr:SAM-dependent methyltransferase [Clostridium sp.]